MKKHVLIAAAAIALATPAFAQTTAPAPGTGTTVTQHAPAQGQWRASKLVGVDVYNQQNEKLGEINELILNSSGQIAGAVIGVGGFLGMGERDVLVPLDKLRFANEGTSTTGSARDGDRKWYPDRAVLNATKDQLKQMPEFKY